mgnify:CR=1 FL=1
MRKTTLAVLLLAAIMGLAYSAPAAGQELNFGDYFADRGLRFDLFQVGDAKKEAVILDHIYLEGEWPENPAGLVEPFENGRYRVRLYDIASNRLVYSRGFDAMIGEYRTTSPASEGVRRVFKRSVRVPCPLRPFVFVIESRDRRNLPHAVFTQAIDPADYHIIRESPAAGDLVFDVLVNGPAKEKVDLVFVAEGYTAEDKDKFRADAERFTGYLFDFEPYKSLKGSFNVRGVFRPSPERAMDEPRQGRFRKTVLNASFNAFDLDRYMLIEEGHRLRELAGQAPYDAIVVLVNSNRYGGGGIYNDYCVTTVDHASSRQVFIHELGHSFAGLADEYYASEVSYNDFYPKGVEPLEPNITALLDPDHVKWQKYLSPGISMPTEYGKEETEALQAERSSLLEARRKELDEAKKAGAGKSRLNAVQSGYDKKLKDLERKLEEVRKRYSHLADKVGVFEGAGYASKGLYRPMMYCIMISSPKNEFCVVCQKAIERMVRYYCGR